MDAGRIALLVAVVVFVIYLVVRMRPRAPGRRQDSFDSDPGEPGDEH